MNNAVTKVGTCAHCVEHEVLRLVSTPKGPRWMCAPCSQSFWLELAVNAEPGAFRNRPPKPPLSLDRIEEGRVLKKRNAP